MVQTNQMEHRPPRSILHLAVPPPGGACDGEGLNHSTDGSHLMGNLLEHLREIAATHALVHTFGYGYLDQLLSSYVDGHVDEQHVRKHHYMLQVAVESRLQELEAIEKDKALRRLMIRREAAQRGATTHITER